MTTNIKSKDEVIIELYNKVDHGSKTEAVIAIAFKCNKSVATIKNHWILNRQIPNNHQDDTISVLQNVIRLQSYKKK